MFKEYQTLSQWVVSHLSCSNLSANCDHVTYEKTLQIPGLVNVDFADVKAVMKNSGTAMLGVGVSSSKNRAQEAAEQATLAPLIGSSIEAATGVVYNITGGKDITLQEVNKVSQVCVGFLTRSLLILEWCFKNKWKVKKC